MNQQRTFTNRAKRIAGLAVSVFALANWLVLQNPGLSPSVASAQVKSGGEIGSKEATMQRMIELASTIARLKPQSAANPANKDLLAELEAAIVEYDRLSESLGGDRAPNNNAGLSPSKPTGNAGVVPPPPAGCTPVTGTFSNNTPTPIPDNNLAGITSVINVAGAGASLWDVNVTVNITHTFPGDLDFTLTSPGGTTVTLSTDNGVSNDNVFAGTVFDDQADPNSQIPYAVNPNITTDHTYANLTVVPTLTPEEPLGAFNGQNPNGAWTLKVSDDASVDTGTLNSWSLEITTFATAPTNDPPVVAANMTPVPIPDNNPTGATSTINVTSPGTSICDVNVTVNITHTFNSDLAFTLTSPGGTVVTLASGDGGSNDNVFNGTTFDDQADPNSQIPYAVNPNIATDHTYTNLVVATPLTPEEPLAEFNGQNPNGTWTLKAVDNAGGDTGTINSWSLSITTCSCAGCVLTCPANIIQSNDPDQCGAVVVYPPPTTQGTCGTVTCTPPSGSSFPVGTTTVVCSGGVSGSQSVTTVYSSGNINIPIPDNNPTGASSTITVPASDSGPVTDVNVRVRINHTFDSDIAIGLSHASAGNALSNNNGGSGDNYGTGATDCSGTKTIFDDSAATPISAGVAPFAGTFQPQSGLSIHNGSANDGTWTLTVVDSVALDSGNIFCWELETTRMVVAPSAMCSFTVTVNDTQPPTITCPANVTAITDQNACPPPPCTTVNFPTPTASDNCPGVNVLCNPASGGCLPVGVTTVTCTATDASGNTATCSFAVSVFDTVLQDDSNPANELLWNSLTGAYRFCCNGTVFTGVGKSLRQGCIFTLDHTSGIDRRVLGRVDKAVHAGTASLQAPPGTIRCSFSDRDTRNDTVTCQ